MNLDGDVRCDASEEAAIWAEFLEILRKHNATFWGWASVWNETADGEIVQGNGRWPEDTNDLSPRGHAVMEDS